MKRLFFLLFLFMVAGAGCSFQVSPTNFTECAARGYPIRESYPRQCQVPGGSVFVEGVGHNPIIPPGSPEPVACTMEAKLCPDGSYVSRTGPHCEFSPCPAPSVKK